MAGRRRRSASQSTDESVDERQIRYVPETAILRKVPEKVKHTPDEWPCFVLADATIYLKDGKTMANALKLDLEGPFILRGRLDIEEKDQLKYLVRPHVKSAYIEIPVSLSYSIGYGPYPVVWASGEAGWFEINPHPRYTRTYDHMCQGITLYYMIMNVYEIAQGTKSLKSRRRTSSSLPLPEVFLKYAVSVGDGVCHSEVESRCHEHAAFLLAHFPKEQSFIWQDTSFYTWMQLSHPDVQRRLLDRDKVPIPTAAPETLAPAKAVAEDDLAPPSDRRSTSNTTPRATGGGLRDSEDTNMADAPSEALAFRAKSTNKLKTESPSGSALPESPYATPASSESAEETVLRMLLDVIREIGQEYSNLSEVSHTIVHQQLHSKCKIKLYLLVKHLSHYFAKDLIDRLGPDWQDSRYVKWLEDRTKEPFVTPDFFIMEDIPRQLVRRQKHYTTLIKQQAKPNSDDLLVIPGARTGMKNVQPPLRGRRSGKHAGLRLASSPRKRYHSDEDDEDDAHSGRGKAAKTIHSFDDDDNTDGIATPHEDLDQDQDQDQEDDEDDGDGSASESGQVARIVVRAEKVPSISLAGPNGTWKCDEDDCGYIVRAAEAQAGRDLIQKHFRHHQEQTRIELALSESSRGHLPINHLLEKIRNLGGAKAAAAAAAADQNPRNGAGLSDEIVRRRLLL